MDIKTPPCLTVKCDSFSRARPELVYDAFIPPPISDIYSSTAKPLPRQNSSIAIT